MVLIIRRFILSLFENQSFSRDRLGCYANGSLRTSSETSFHELPSKSKCPTIRKQIASSFSSQLIVLLFLRNSHMLRYLANIFSSVFLCTFRKLLHCIKKKGSENFLESSQKNTRGEALF